jgi:hypothetical protein
MYEMKITEKTNNEINNENFVVELDKNEKSYIYNKTMNTLSTIPISDEDKKKIINIAMIFWKQGHSGFSASYVSENVFYYIYKGTPIEDIKYDLYSRYDYCEEEDKKYQKIITNNVIELVKAIRESFTEPKYYKFYFDLIKKILTNKPFLNITFEDENWVEVGENINRDEELVTMYQHKEAGEVFKEVKKDGTFRIYQIEYFIFQETFDNNRKNTYTSSNSIIDITNYNSWYVNSVLIDVERVQKFIDQYNKDGIVFSQESEILRWK